MSRCVFAMALGVLIAALATSCAARQAPPGAKRTVYMTAVEYKGAADVAKEAFPATRVDGAGYTLKEPQAGRWETSSYRWDPGTVVVYEGDDVELRIWGVNGDEHPSALERYSPQFTVARGQLTVLNFKADRAGIFSLVCTVHRPSMQSQLVVLPR